MKFLKPLEARESGNRRFRIGLTTPWNALPDLRGILRRPQA